MVICLPQDRCHKVVTMWSQSTKVVPKCNSSNSQVVPSGFQVLGEHECYPCIFQVAQSCSEWCPSFFPYCSQVVSIHVSRWPRDVIGKCLWCCCSGLTSQILARQKWKKIIGIFYVSVFVIVMMRCFGRSSTSVFFIMIKKAKDLYHSIAPKMLLLEDRWPMMTDPIQSHKDSHELNRAQLTPRRPPMNWNELRWT